MTLKFYADLISQPTRAVYIFLKVNKIPFELCRVALRRGEHLTPEFKEKFNRLGKVPFIHDGDFKLAESVAIVRYVSKKHSIDNNWYPQDIKKQARVDEYLEWQHLNTRGTCAQYVRQKYLYPSVTGKHPTPEILKPFEDNMVKCLDEIENVWLKNTPYVAGDQISIADIFAACEIEQPRVAGFEAREGRPRLNAWLDKVHNEANPFYDEAYTFFNKLLKMVKEKEMNSKV